MYTYIYIYIYICIYVPKVNDVNGDIRGYLGYGQVLYDGRVSASFLPRLRRTAFTPLRNLPAAADLLRPVAMLHNKNPLKSQRPPCKS